MKMKQQEQQQQQQQQQQKKNSSPSRTANNNSNKITETYRQPVLLEESMQKKIDFFSFPCFRITALGTWEET